MSIDHIDDAVAGATYDRNICMPARYLHEALVEYHELEERLDWFKAFVPAELLEPKASSIDTAIVLLRRAAEALDEVPASLRSSPPMLFTNAPRVTPRVLLEEADGIAERLAEIRKADARPPSP